VQIRSHAQKYFIKVQKLGLAAGLPPAHPRRRFAMELQSSAAGSSAAAVPLLHVEPHGAPVPVPGPSGAVAHGCIGWNCPGGLPAGGSSGKCLCQISIGTARFRQWLSEWSSDNVSGCFSEMRGLDWAGASASGIPAWLNSDARSQIAPPVTLPGNLVSQ